MLFSQIIHFKQASSDNSSRLWDVSTGENIRHYAGHRRAVVCVALNDSSEAVGDE